MKRLIAISTLLIYFTLSVVQVVIIHYCHGELESIALMENGHGCCEGMHSCHASCCEDIVIEVDFDSDHIFTEEISFISPGQIVELVFFTREDKSAAEEFVTEYIPPPPEPLSQPKLFSLHTSFLFYG